VPADEPAAAGGTDTAATPLELVASGLAACTAITLRMYAERKGWDLGAVRVDCRAFVAGSGYRFERVVRLGAPLADEQKARLGEIAEKTPVAPLSRADSNGAGWRWREPRRIKGLRLCARRPATALTGERFSGC